MEYKIVWNMANGLEEKAYKNPMRPDEFMMPGGCIEIEPPEFDVEKHFCKYIDGEWVLEEIPEPEKPDYSLYHELAEDVPEEIIKEEPEAPVLSIIEQPIE